ncbi:retinol dehydrogenase 12 [Xylariomycetidae sp. FL0641]|nr:retinol dehydrogenase 12 [Xylariomycetidae sp. FL0641]
MPDFDVTPEERATLRAFFHRQLSVDPPAVTRDEVVSLQGKTAIITGSNTGLGFECARQLLDLGTARLILAVRNESSGQQARTNLLAGRSTAAHAVEVWPLDLSRYESVTSFAARAKGLERLDIFINNAGLTKRAFTRNPHTRHEETIQVNYLSPALLTILVLPILRAKNAPDHPGRLVNVNSDVAAWAKFQERDSVPLLAALDREDNFDHQDRYWTSKLLGQLFLSELAKRVPATVAVVNAPNPGLSKSDLSREHRGTLGGFLFGLFLAVFARDANVGARALTDAAVKHGPESHGQYLEDGRIQPMAPLVYKPQGIKIAEQLWKETMQELALAGVAEIINELSDR